MSFPPHGGETPVAHTFIKSGETGKLVEELCRIFKKWGLNGATLILKTSAWKNSSGNRSAQKPILPPRPKGIALDSFKHCPAFIFTRERSQISCYFETWQSHCALTFRLHHIRKHHRKGGFLNTQVYSLGVNIMSPNLMSPYENEKVKNRLVVTSPHQKWTQELVLHFHQHCAAHQASKRFSLC